MSLHDKQLALELLVNYRANINVVSLALRVSVRTLLDNLRLVHKDITNV
jgi:hypothetical protein